MHFTREPILESVITPREGCKLSLRRAGVQEEYMVDVVEVVSFGDVLFFRSTDKGKTFLLPAREYDLVEQKEARMVLKTTHLEKSIKIEGNVFSNEETVQEEKKESPRRKKRRNNHARREKMPVPEEPVSTTPPLPASEEVQQVSPSVVRRIIPPPNTLIKEHMHRYRSLEEEKPSEIQPEQVAYAVGEPIPEAPKEESSSTS